MAKQSRAEYNLYEINGGYKKASPGMRRAIRLSRIDTSWMDKIKLTDKNGNITIHSWREPGVIKKYFESQLEKE